MKARISAGPIVAAVGGTPWEWRKDSREAMLLVTISMVLGLLPSDLAYS